jgi:hypothetical protein
MPGEPFASRPFDPPDDPPRIRDNVMTMTATDNLAIARKYLEALENGAEGGALAEFFTKDVVQED